MGQKDEGKELIASIGGFVLAYVDKEYPSGTPLTCTENGYLTELLKDDLSCNSYKVHATYWKPEFNEEWGVGTKVKVSGRHWVKVR